MRHMNVPIATLREKMMTAMRKRGLTEKEAKIVVEPFIDAELRGKRTHGINKFFVIDDGLKTRGTPEIIRDKFNYALIDGKHELGFICADLATDIVIKKTKTFGNAICALTNTLYFSVLWPYAQKIAGEGFLSIIMKGGGPSGVPPFGGVQPIMGFNPIAIGIPTRKGPLVLDMAASEKTYGEINLARVEKRTLKEGIFLDTKGNFTTDPQAAETIIPFGGAKGSGLNLMIEIFTGAFIGAKMGRKVNDTSETGTCFMAFSPEMFTQTDVFYDKVGVLMEEIKASTPMEGFREVFLPGEQSSKRREKNLKKGSVDIHEDIWNALNKYAEGIEIKKILNIKI